MVCYLASVFHSWYSEASLYRWYRDILCFHCPLLLHHHALTLGFLLQAFMVCPWFFSIPLLDSVFMLFHAMSHFPTPQPELHIFCAVPLWCSSAIRLSPGSCHIFHCKVKASRLPKISLALFASQKVWQPSTLFSKSGYSFLFPWNYLLVLFPCSLLDSTVKIKTVSINNIRI